MFESISPQKILFEKVTNVATSKEKPHELKSNIFVNASIVWIPKENVWSWPPPPKKNCCSYSLDFHMKQFTCIANQQKHLFHGAHTKDVIWGNSEVCTNSEYTWIVQPIVWTLNPYEWKPRAQPLSLECVFVCKL